MNWFMMGLALTGTILLSSKKVKFRKVRLTAFILWVFSNAYWSFVSLDPALRLQFFIYFCLALWGVWNNWREQRCPTKSPKPKR